MSGMKTILTSSLILFPLRSISFTNFRISYLGSFSQMCVGSCSSVSPIWSHDRENSGDNRASNTHGIEKLFWSRSEAHQLGAPKSKAHLHAHTEHDECEFVANGIVVPTNGSLLVRWLIWGRKPSRTWFVVFRFFGWSILPRFLLKNRLPCVVADELLAWILVGSVGKHSFGPNAQSSSQQMHGPQRTNCEDVC